MKPCILLLAALAALSACAPATTPGNFPEVCAEQAEMATAGRTDGRPQTITCPR